MDDILNSFQFLTIAEKSGWASYSTASGGAKDHQYSTSKVSIASTISHRREKFSHQGMLELLFTNRTPQSLSTFTPLYTWTDTSITRSAQTNSDHWISYNITSMIGELTIAKLFHVRAEHERTRPRPCTRSKPAPRPLYSFPTHKFCRTRNRPAR